jgi:hypothetical protein
MIAFMILLAVAALGLIFDPDTPPEPAEPAVAEDTADPPPVAEAADPLDAYAPNFFALETAGAGDTGDTVSQAAYVVITISGVALLASLIILVMLPQVTLRTKRVAMLLFAAAIATVAVGGLFFDDLEQGYLTGNLSAEIYVAILVGTALFIVTAPLVHTRFRNISNVFIASMGVLALIGVYFLTEPGGAMPDSAEAQAEAGYRSPILVTGAKPAPAPKVDYAPPLRVNVDTPGIAAYAQIVYCAFLIVLLHIFLHLAMGKTTFRRFWPYWHIVGLSTLAWSGMFYAIGVPLWQIVVVIGIAMISAPNVMHIISTYKIKQRRDTLISQWSG